VRKAWCQGGPDIGGGAQALWSSAACCRFDPASVPSGATTGSVAVTTPGGVLTSNRKFLVIPQITSFAPINGPVGTKVVITGAGFTGTTKVMFGATATSFTVNGNTQVTATVPRRAVTGKISITTAGGTATSATVFKVT
jgi:hypothetical protein